MTTKTNAGAPDQAPSKGDVKQPPAPQPDTRTAAQREEDDRWAEIRALVRSVVPAIKIALPKGSQTDPETFAGLCLTVLRKDWADNLLPNDTISNRDKALIWASDFSLKRVFVQAAELDLQPGSSLGQCFFIRYGYDATFQIGVWGYVTLMRRGADVAEVWSDVIYEHDEFRIVRGARRELFHAINPLTPRADRGRVLGAYACVRYKDDSVDWEFVNAEDLELARETSRAKNSPAYQKWPDEMRRRTAIKRLAKYVEKCLAANSAADIDESDTLREDLAEMIRTVKTVTVQGEAVRQEVSKQKSTLDSIVAAAGGERALPAHPQGSSAREQLDGAQQRQGAEVAK